MLAVLEVAGLDDAIDVVNSVEYGLSAAVYTRDIATALRRSTASTPGSSTSTPPPSAPRSPCRSAAPSTPATASERRGRGIEQFSQLKTVYVDYSGRLQKAQIDTHPLDDPEAR